MPATSRYVILPARRTGNVTVAGFHGKPSPIAATQTVRRLSLAGDLGHDEEEAHRVSASRTRTANSINAIAATINRFAFFPFPYGFLARAT